MKVLILDSGPLINLSMNGFLEILAKLKEKTGVRIAITKDVKYEVIDRPIGIDRYELGALRVQGLLDEGVLEMPEAFGVNEGEVASLTKELIDKANHFLEANGTWVELVSGAEMSCLALSTLLEKEDTETLIGTDERTTRVLCEDPKSLARLMSERLHKRVVISSEFRDFSKYKFLRSSEIVFAAYKKGLLDVSGKKALEAALYACKYKGTAIGFEEIEQLKKL